MLMTGALRGIAWRLLPLYVALRFHGPHLFVRRCLCDNVSVLLGRHLGQPETNPTMLHIVESSCSRPQAGIAVIFSPCFTTQKAVRGSTGYRERFGGRG